MAMDSCTAARIKLHCGLLSLQSRINPLKSVKVRVQNTTWRHKTQFAGFRQTFSLCPSTALTVQLYIYTIIIAGIAGLIGSGHLGANNPAPLPFRDPLRSRSKITVIIFTLYFDPPMLNTPIRLGKPFVVCLAMIQRQQQCKVGIQTIHAHLGWYDCSEHSCPVQHELLSQLGTHSIT